MKLQKGRYGYINKKKKENAIKSAIGLLFIAGLVIAGYLILKTKLNWFTFAAIMFAMPVGRMVVNLIMILPHKSMPKESYEIIQTIEDENIKLAYDLVITSYENIMEIDAISIKGNTVCAYSKSEKLNEAKTTKFIKDILANNGCAVTLKIYKDVNAFISRTKEMKQNLSSDEKSEKAIEREKQKEEKILNTLYAISL